MDDKTSSRLQPSTTFCDSSTSTAHSRHLPLTSFTTYSSTSINSIISAPNTTHIMEQKKQFDISNLMSPPEAPLMESFSRATPGPVMPLKSKTTQPGNRLPLSPPVSPEELNKPHTTPEDLGRVNIRDPILFPEGQSSPSSQPPLFVEEAENRRVVEDHIAARKVDSFRAASPPRSSDYKLALEFKSQVAHQYNQNRKLWRAREMAQLREDSALKSGSRRYLTIAPASAGSKPVKPTPKQVAKPKSRVNKPGTTKPTVRASTPNRQPAREDKDFNALEDYCPSVSSLPSRPNSLKVDWKGAPIDLRSDIYASLLHPDEVALAANLRLDCATYLTSKRRIFIKRTECLRIGKEFRKTDAQQACKIDVNKASKLWTAFDKVGWLNSKWVQGFV